MGQGCTVANTVASAARLELIVRALKRNAQPVEVQPYSAYARRSERVGYATEAVLVQAVCSAIGAHRFVDMAAVLQNNTQVHLRVGAVGHQLQHPAQCSRGTVQIAQVLSYQCQLKPCIGVIRCEPGSLLQHLRGCPQLPALTLQRAQGQADSGTLGFQLVSALPASNENC